MRLITGFFIFCLCSLSIEAQQIKTPAASPSIQITQMVGLSKVSLDYSRPSVKGRTIFSADGLVPFGALWRTGANASTKIEFSEEVTINDQKVLAGKYALYTIPNAGEWTIIIHKNTSHWGKGDYTETEDLMRFNVKSQKSPAFVESLDIGIHNIGEDKADLVIQWENTMVSFPIMVEVESRVMNDIKTAMAGTSRGDYYTAARYYYDKDKDLSQALSWIKKANEMDAKYWQLRLQSEIEAKLGDYATAVKTAMTAKESAAAAGNDGYVRMNEKNIKMWKEKMGKRS